MYGGHAARVPQLASPAPVAPFARLGVSPSDFPFLAQIRGHDDERLAESPLLQYDLKFAARFFAVPGRLVDLGCGTGRLLVSFARRGFAVLGVDLSEEMLEVAREKATAAGQSIPLVKANLVDLDGIASATFDYAACLFSTLGMISGSAARRRFQAHWASTRRRYTCARHSHVLPIPPCSWPASWGGA